jgi:hypothetical protein
MDTGVVLVSNTASEIYNPHCLWENTDRTTGHGQATGKLLSLSAAIRMHPSYHDQVLLVGVMYGLTSA